MPYLQKQISTVSWFWFELELLSYSNDSAMILTDSTVWTAADGNLFLERKVAIKTAIVQLSSLTGTVTFNFIITNFILEITITYFP